MLTAVGIFPEGRLTRDPDNWPERAKTGTVRLALRTGAPIVPVAMVGAHRVLSKRRVVSTLTSNVLLRPKVLTAVGDPIDVRTMVTNADNPDPDEIRQATDRVMEQLVKLVEVLRDEVAPIPSASNEFIHPRAELRMISTAGTMYGMPNKTTIYLPDDLKRALEREAKRRGCSEAQVVRDAVTGIVTRPRPNAGLFAADPFAERVDELLAGFGEQ